MERIKIKLPEHFKFSTTIAIRITDLNYGGHVGNDSFLTLLHEARQQFLNYFGYSELAFEGVGLIMADAIIEFKKEINYGDAVTIWVTATDFDKLGFDIYYKMEIEETNSNYTLVGKAKTGMICFDYKTKRKVTTPKKAIQKLLNN